MIFLVLPTSRDRMDIKRLVPRNPIFLAIALLLILLLAFISYNALVKSEETGTVITAPMHVQANSTEENASYYVLTKIVKTMNGISPLKSDNYNIIAISIYPRAFWYNSSFEKGWEIPVQIAGFGATRSGYGILTANGLKTITLRLENSLNVSTFSTMDLNGKEDHFANMLAAAIDSLQDKTWPRYSPEDVRDSSSKTVTRSPDSQTDTTKNRFSTTLNKWQYSDLSGGDKSDAVYAIDTFSICSPGGTEELNYSATLSWGMFSSSRNEICLRIHLPPDPESMTQEQLDKYHISVTTSSSGQKFYTLDQIDCEAF
jgi:hypothetical protein